jgi:hypothetical protein
MSPYRLPRHWSRRPTVRGRKSDFLEALGDSEWIDDDSIMGYLAIQVQKD